MKFSDFIQQYGNAYDHPISLVNIQLPDQPLLYVNQAFLDMCKYNADEVIGKNCRFLQGAESDGSSVRSIREHIQEFVPSFQDLINYDKYGEKFYNRIVLIPFKESEAHFFIGLQHKIDEHLFSPQKQISKYVLFDKLVNPMTALSSAVRLARQEKQSLSLDTLKKDYLEPFNRIREFILSL